MSFDCVTLYVIHSTRAAEIVADTVAAARWASQHDCKIVVATTKSKLNEYEKLDVDAIVETAVPDTPDLIDFRFNDGLRGAIERGIKFNQALCLRDTALCFQGKIDRWLANYFYQYDADLIGTADVRCYAENFLKTTDFFSTWHVPHDSWEYAPSTFTISSSTFALSWRLAKELFYYHLLLPAKFEEWPLTYGCYMSWLTQILHFHHVLLGSVDRPESPFYVTNDLLGAYNPSPHLLNNDFLVYCDVTKVRGYTEELVRKWCRESRESSR